MHADDCSVRQPRRATPVEDGAVEQPRGHDRQQHEGRIAASELAGADQERLCRDEHRDRHRLARAEQAPGEQHEDGHRHDERDRGLQPQRPLLRAQRHDGS